MINLPRIEMPHRRLLVSLLLLALSGERVRASDQSIRPVALDDYLLDADFVVEATAITSTTTGAHLMPLEIERVMLGALPHRRVVLRSLGRGFTSSQRLLAWATWDGAHGDTCYGGAVAVAADGAMTRYAGMADFRLDGKPVDQPGTYERLVRRLEARSAEHATNWLASGASVVVMTVAGRRSNSNEVMVALERPRPLVGAATNYPQEARWRSRTDCVFPANVGDSILLAVPSHAPKTLEIRTCPDRLLLTMGYRTPFSVSLEKLPQVLKSSGDTLTFQHVHGVEEPVLDGRW